MGKRFNQLCRAYFSFNKKDRNGILVLMVLIVVLIVAGRIMDKIEYISSGDATGMHEFIQLMESMQNEVETMPVYFFFNPNDVAAEKLDSFSIPAIIKSNLIKYRNAGGSFRKPADLRKIYGMNDSLFAVIEPWLELPQEDRQNSSVPQDVVPVAPEGVFDPNTAEAETLLYFGLKQRQVNNLIKYRSMGGVLYKPDDLLKIYGIDSSFFASIEKHIHIQEVQSEEELNSSAIHPVELNSADSSELILLQGIGPVFASRIIKYRNLLGGFYDVRQLLEVYGFPEETFLMLEQSFSVDTLKIEKLRLNFTEFSELLRHPYLEKDNVASILNFRQKNGPFSEPLQILQSGLVDSTTFNKIKPYITCR